MTKYMDPAGLLNVLIVALIGGVGLVALFAIGLRGVAIAEIGGRTRPIGLALAGTCFGIVLVGIGLGVHALLAA